MHGMPLRKGFSMKISGVHLNRPDLHEIAADLGIAERDILSTDGVLTVYNTSKTSQEMIDDNALVAFIAMTIGISPDDITELKEVEEEPMVLDFDLSEFEDDDY